MLLPNFNFITLGKLPQNRIKFCIIEGTLGIGIGLVDQWIDTDSCDSPVTCIDTLNDTSSITGTEQEVQAGRVRHG